MQTSFKSRIFIGIILFVGVIALVLWIKQSHATPMPAKTNQQAIPIQSEIHGKIAKIHVKNNQFVKRGDVLFELDPTDVTLAITQAKAQLATAQRQKKTESLSLQEAQAMIDQKQAELLVHEAAYKRKEALAVKGYFPKQQLLEASSQVQSAKAALILAKTQYERAHMMMDPAVSDPNMAKATADLITAEKNLYRTKITAPIDGKIMNMQLVKDQVISAHQPLLILSP